MSHVRRWKRGSTVPAIADTFLDSTGAPLDIAGATVVFMMGSVASGSAVVLGTATVTSATADGATTFTGTYDWGATDLASPGLYYAGWQIRYAGGGTEILPQGGTIPGEPDWRLVRVTQ